MSLSMFEKEVDSSLRIFADDLKADEEYQSEGIRMCEKVRHLLEQATQNNDFSISSTHYAGSVGKRTDVKQPDFDIVMKINNRSPPFKDVLEFFKQNLEKQANDLEIRNQSISMTKYSIQFSFTNGMEVDLLPAVAQISEKEVLQKMKKSFKNRRFYSSSLVDKQVEFMKDQTAFAHAVARLAKHWYKNMGTNHINGGSTIFECLAVAAVIGEEDNDQESMCAAFKRVVEKVENLDQLRLAFETYAKHCWRIKGLVHGQQVPYLLEPANSFNNLLEGLNPDVIKVLKGNAISMRDRLRNLIDKQNYCTSTAEGLQINFTKLFRRKRRCRPRRKRNKYPKVKYT